MRTHQEIDQLNLELGRAVAAKLRRQPELFERVVADKLRRWRARIENGDLGSSHYLEQWESLKAAGMEACLAQVIEESERGTALRQASPFAGVLTSTERMSVLRAWRTKNEARRP